MMLSKGSNLDSKEEDTWMGGWDELRQGSARQSLRMIRPREALKI